MSVHHSSFIIRRSSFIPLLFHSTPFPLISAAAIRPTAARRRPPAGRASPRGAAVGNVHRGADRPPGGRPGGGRPSGWCRVPLGLLGGPLHGLGVHLQLLVFLSRRDVETGSRGLAGERRGGQKSAIVPGVQVIERRLEDPAAGQAAMELELPGWGPAWSKVTRTPSSVAGACRSSAKRTHSRTGSPPRYCLASVWSVTAWSPCLSFDRAR